MPHLQVNVRDVFTNVPRHTLVQPKARTPEALKEGDLVIYCYDDVQNLWCRILLIEHIGNSSFRKDSLYWNFLVEGTGENDGAYFHQDQKWGVLRGADRELDVSNTILMTPDSTVVYIPPWLDTNFV